MHFYMPKKGLLSLHSGCNMGRNALDPLSLFSIAPPCLLCLLICPVLPPLFPLWSPPCSLMHYYMPKKGVLSLHSGCNMGRKGDVTLFFGLSGG